MNWPSFWTILEAIAALQALLAAYMFYLVARIARTPLGARLAAVATVLTAESIAALAIYAHWQAEGYGASISAPLIAIQALSLAGTLVLLDTIRR
ncbi:MAG: hypothetical protein LRS46_01440 [Desulfurococcales archaeon]|nr:hypothetical protein [Desulfurococcales archaeon]